MRVLVLAMLLTGCTEPTLNLQPLSSDELSELTRVVSMTYEDARASVARITTMVRTETCPEVTTEAGRTFFRGGCTSSAGIAYAGVVELVGDPRTTATYTFKQFEIGGETAYDGTVSYGAAGMTMNLDVARTEAVLASALTVQCTTTDCEIDGTVENDAGFADVTGTSSGATASFEIAGADSHVKNGPDALLLIDLEVGCRSWSLRGRGFRPDRSRSSC